jgi:hypothetical protein
MTTSTSLAALAAFASPSCRPPTACTSNPTHASTTMAGGKVCFENDNYRITMGDDNSVNICNKNTGENYLAWGDPHMQVDGQQAFDFWGTTTLSLDDGTKLTIQTTPWANDPSMTLSSKVTITNGDYGVQVSGVDSNKVGDLGFEETEHFGGLLDALVDDGNLLHENPFGQGFLAVDSCGRLHKVDQEYINQTDLQKGGALEKRFAQAFQQMAGLLALTFIGSFLSGLAASKGDCGERAGGSQAPRGPRLGGMADTGADNSFVMVMGRSNPGMSWFVAAAGWT